MRRLAASLIAAAVALAVLLQAPAALAHATLVRAEPSDGAVVATAPSVLRLTFNEPVSPLAIRLFGPDGGAVPLGDVTAANSGIAIPVPALQNGTHVLSWRVISADGHPVGGALVFSIGAPSAQQPSGALPPADPAVRLALWGRETRDLSRHRDRHRWRVLSRLDRYTDSALMALTNRRLGPAPFQ